MALSFGRGKKGQSDDAASAPAPEAVPAAGASKIAATEGLDESWFEGAFEEESGTPQTLTATPAVPSAYDAPPAASPASDFDMFADLEGQASRPARAASFDMADAALAPTAGAEDSTPFDNTSPPKAKGGLKKILPVLGLLLLLGGGGYFWISQQSSGVEEGEVTPPSTRPAPPSPPASVTAPGATQLAATKPAATKPAATKPAATKPAIVAPIGKAPVIASGDPKIKAQLKKLWDEGAAAKKVGKTADARKKWQEAVKLGKSKPGNEQSAKLIQDAINKLK